MTEEGKQESTTGIDASLTPDFRDKEESNNKHCSYLIRWVDKLLKRHIALLNPVIEGHGLPHDPLVVPCPSEGDNCCVCVVYANRYVHLKYNQNFFQYSS